MPGDPVRRLIDRQLALTGISTFEGLRLPLGVVATDIRSGRRRVFRAGPLGPALLASTAIPGIFPAVRIDGEDYMDGGIADNTPISVGVESGARELLVISLMTPSRLLEPPATWDQLISRTIQLSLDNRLQSDFALYKNRVKLVVICPVTAAASAWDMRRDHVRSLIDRSREATVRLLAEQGSRLFKRSALHHLQLET
jgi:NTE family protein